MEILAVIVTVFMIIIQLHVKLIAQCSLYSEHSELGDFSFTFGNKPKRQYFEMFLLSVTLFKVFAFNATLWPKVPFHP